MSYEIVKGINMAEKSVYIKSSCNNVSPRIYDWWLSTYLTTILNESGKKEAVKEILLAYYDGNFQAGIENKYSKCINNISTEDRNKYNFDYYWRNPEAKEEVKNFLFNKFVGRML